MYLVLLSENKITGYLYPNLDGNCGFRAIAFSVKRNDRAYQDEDQCLSHKQNVEIFFKYKEICTSNFPAFQIDRLERASRKAWTRAILQSGSIVPVLLKLQQMLMAFLCVSIPLVAIHAAKLGVN